MREILFRGKRDPKYGEGWYFGVSYIDHEGDCIMADHCSKRVVISETVGQYTERTDKNDKKIFDGDIIQNIENGNVGRVSYMLEYCAFMIYVKVENRYYWLYDNDFKKIEIIGNIYDNPELIGEN
jgi:uncharacterized phage protein (TIGR01671 family)